MSIVEDQRGTNTAICFAICERFGLMLSRFLEEGMTKDRFRDFLSEIVALLALQELFVILCDNAPSRIDAPSVGPYDYASYLPKYSPFLNACEMAGSVFEAALKRRLTKPVQREMCDRDSLRFESLHIRRENISRREVEPSLDAVTLQECCQWANHVITYLPKCLREEDIFD